MISPVFAVSDLLAEPTHEARLAYLRSEGLADETGLAWVLDRAEELVHDEPAAARELAELCASAGPAAVSARAGYLCARVHAERGELDQALALIEQARADWWGAGQHTAALRTDLGRMKVLDDLGRHEDAAAVGEALIAALAELPARPEEHELREWLAAAALENLGVAHSFTGQHERALAAYAEAEAAYRALDMPADSARLLANRGVELLEWGRPREALEALRPAAAAFTDLGDRLWSAKCLGDIAKAHQQLGQLTEALRLLEPARTILEELGASAEAARLRLATAGAYLAVGLFTEARVEASVAAEQTTSAGMLHDAALAHFAVAAARLGAGELDAAAAELNVAGELFERVGDRQYQARVRLAAVDVYLAKGRRRAAADEAASSAEVFAAGGWLVPLALARLRQADLAGDEHAEEGFLRDAGDVVERLSLPQLGYPYRLRLARLRRRQGRDGEAEELLRAAVDGIEQLGASLPDHALRTAYRAERLAAHDELVSLLVARGGQGDALRACVIGDRAKAATLVDLVDGTVPSHVRGTGEPAETDRLRMDLSSAYGALLTVEDADRRHRLRTRIDELEQQISTLRLRQPVPSTPARPSGPVPFGELPPAQTLAYHIAGNDVIAFAGRAGDVQAHRLVGVLPAVDAELDRLAAQWTRFRLGSTFGRRHHDALLATTRQSLHALHRLLLAPVEALLDGGDELVVVPHRRLHQVPFHALYDGKAHLLEHRAVTVAPTATGARHDNPIPRAGTALVLAVPDAHAPAVAAEAAAIGGALPDATVLVGAGATSAALADGVPGPAILHIACHGLYRAANPMFSSLRLADRWMSATEVLRLDLDGALVTLSACESGKHARGTAEPLGLAWAFLAAGAAGAVVSQWVVHDDSTAGLMASLYRHLASGSAPASALRAAQLDTAETHPHPFYWAPFTYVAAPARLPDRSTP